MKGDTMKNTAKDLKTIRGIIVGAMRTVNAAQKKVAKSNFSCHNCGDAELDLIEVSAGLQVAVEKLVSIIKEL